MNISERRTIRRYADRDVPSALLNELLGTASRAATMGNMQLYSVVVTREQAVKDALSPHHFCQPMATDAPVVLTFCADFHRATLWCEQRKADPGYDNFLSFINAMSDTLLYTQSFCTLAEERGLGTCYLGTTVYNPMGIINVLRLPRLVFPVATITVGWPAEMPEQTDRLPLDGIVHKDTYHDYSPTDIDRIYAHKEQTEENRRFVALNNKETLAQVYTDCRYTRKDNEAMTAGMLEALRHQGFM